MTSRVGCKVISLLGLLNFQIAGAQDGFQKHFRNQCLSQEKPLQHYEISQVMRRKCLSCGSGLRCIVVTNGNFRHISTCKTSMTTLMKFLLIFLTIQ